MKDIPSLLNQLNQKDNIAERHKAAFALGNTQDLAHLQVLSQLLHDPLARTREVGVLALGQMNNPACLSYLVEALNDEDEDVRLEAASMIYDLDNIGEAALLKILVDSTKPPLMRAAAAWGLGNSREDTVGEALLHHITDPNSSVQSFVIKALGVMRFKAASASIINALTHESVEVRRHAALALSRIKDPDTETALINALKDADEEVRRWTCLALGWVKSKDAIPHLVDILRTDLIDDVRADATTALGQIGDASALPALVIALQSDRYNWVRGYAARSIGQMDAREQIDLLQMLARNEHDPVIVFWCEWALGKLKVPSVFPKLITYLESPETYIRYNALEVLADFGDPAAIPVLENIVNDLENHRVFRQYAQKALNKLKGHAGKDF
jgi:HEAT repeat protein